MVPTIEMFLNGLFLPNMRPFPFFFFLFLPLPVVGQLPMYGGGLYRPIRGAAPPVALPLVSDPLDGLYRPIRGAAPPFIPFPVSA